MAADVIGFERADGGRDLADLRFDAVEGGLGGGVVGAGERGEHGGEVATVAAERAGVGGAGVGAHGGGGRGVVQVVEADATERCGDGERRGVGGIDEAGLEVTGAERLPADGIAGGIDGGIADAFVEVDETIAGGVTEGGMVEVADAIGRKLELEVELRRDLGAVVQERLCSPLLTDEGTEPAARRGGDEAQERQQVALAGAVGSDEDGARAQLGELDRAERAIAGDGDARQGSSHCKPAADGRLVTSNTLGTARIQRCGTA